MPVFTESCGLSTEIVQVRGRVTVATVSCFLRQLGYSNERKEELSDFQCSLRRQVTDYCEVARRKARKEARKVQGKKEGRERSVFGGFGR